MTINDLPAVNASLNALSALFVLAGWWFIRRERKVAHIAAMTCALLVGIAFLACYLTYHLKVQAITRFTTPGLPRVIYLTILISHTILAAVVLPLVIATVVPALRARWERHRRLARWTLPMWLYVSVTGVLVYLMLYRWFPPTR